MENLEDVLINEVAIPEIGVLNLEQLQNKIKALGETEDGEPLKNAMKELKKALIQNPAACSLLLPEDIGQMVMYLKKTIDKSILEANSPKKKDKAPSVSLKNLTKEQLDNLSPDDL